LFATASKTAWLLLVIARHREGWGGMTTATISRQHDGSARLYTPFDAEFVTQLKARIPAPLRRWDKPDKCWIIEAAGVFRAISLAEQFYGEVEDIPATPSQFLVTTPFAVLHLLPDAPADLIPVVYRHLAKVNHPDRGGDTRQMQRINEAYETICKAVQR